MTLPARLPRSWPIVLSLVFLTVMVAYPVALLLLQSVFPNLLAGDLSWSFRAYEAIWTTDGVSEMLWNSLRWAMMTTAMAWCMGIPLGWILARVNIRGKMLMRILLLIPIMTPPYVFALSYTMLMVPGGIGDVLVGVPHWIRNLFFSFWGVSFVMAVCSFGYVAIAVEASLRLIHARLEHAATMLGASSTRSFCLILLPLLLPALLNSGLLVFLDALSNFGVPAILGPRANLPLLPAEIYSLITSWPLDFPLATALSSLLLVCAVITLLLNHWLMQRSTRGASSRGSAVAETQPGWWGSVLVWMFLAAMFLAALVLPSISMLLSSVIERWNTGDDQLPTLTMQHYIEILTVGSRGLQALWTSLWLSTVAATICMFAGGFIAYSVTRFSGLLARLLESMAVLPRVLPKIVMAVALIMAWNAPWIGTMGVRVYGTVWILLVAYVSLYLSDTLRYADTGMRQINVRLEHAAESLGATQWQRIVSIALPLLWPSLFIGWLMTFIACMRDLVASIILLPPGVETVGTFIFNQFEQGDTAAAMAMATLVVIMGVVVLSVAYAVNTRIAHRAARQP